MVTIDEPLIAANARARQHAGDPQAAGNGEVIVDMKFDQPFGDRAARHDVAGEHEQRNRQQHFAVDREPEVLNQEFDLAVGHEYMNVGGGHRQHQHQALA